jgi:hypothetical protein
MNTVKRPKIKWKYVGDRSLEKQKESEKALEHIYFSLFKQARENVVERKKNEE